MTPSRSLITDHQGEALTVTDRAGNEYPIIGTYYYVGNVVTLYDFIIIGNLPVGQEKEMYSEANRIAIEAISLHLGKNTDFRYQPKIKIV